MNDPGDILCACGLGFNHERHECPYELMRCENDDELCNCCVQCQMVCLGLPEEDCEPEEDDDESRAALASLIDVTLDVVVSVIGLIIVVDIVGDADHRRIFVI